MELTRNGQVIQRHTMEARIHSPLLVPPSKSISDMLGIGAEITIQLIMKVGFGGGRKCRQLIEDVFERGRRTLKEKLARHFEVHQKNTHSSLRSLRVWVVDVDVHKCVRLIELGTDNVSRSFNPIFLPSSFLEVV